MLGVSGISLRSSTVSKLFFTGTAFLVSDFAIIPFGEFPTRARLRSFRAV